MLTMKCDNYEIQIPLRYFFRSRKTFALDGICERFNVPYIWFSTNSNLIQRISAQIKEADKANQKRR